jgi:hypothetical protein
MEPISTIVGFIDPIGGKNSEAQPNNPELAYQSIDFFYDQQRLLHPDVILTARITRSQAILERDSYSGIIFDRDGTTASLAIRGRLKQTIVLKDTYYNITLNIVLPADTVNTQDVPVFRTEGIFFLQGTITIAEENLTGFNADRIIFEHTGITELRDVNSNIIMNRSGIIHRAGITFQGVFPAFLRMTFLSNFLHEGPETSPESIVRQIGPSRAEIRGVPTGGPCRTNGFFIRIKGIIYYWGSQTALKISVDGRLSPFNPAFAFNQAKCSISSTAKIHPNQEHTEVGVRIVDAVFESETEGFSLSSVMGTNIHNVNLINIIPFPNDTVAETSEYTLVQNFSSISNNGSTLHKPHLITTDYVHTQFDGYVFMIEATTKDITITIPSAPVSNDRTFQYKRIDYTNHQVTIKMGTKSFRMNHGRSDRYLPSMTIYGYDDTIWSERRCC